MVSWWTKTTGGFKTTDVLGAEWWKQRGQVLASKAGPLPASRQAGGSVGILWPGGGRSTLLERW